MDQFQRLAGQQAVWQFLWLRQNTTQGTLNDRMNWVSEITAVGLQSGGAGSNWADPVHDAAGNMTTIPVPSSPTSSYTAKWDAWNRLVSLDSGTTASYEYDGLNRRIVRTEASTTRHFYYNEAWQCLEERATEGGDAIKQFVWGAGYIDELVLRDRDANANSGDGLEERVYALSDAQYNVGVLVSDTGSVLERFAYSPYGESVVLNADLTASGSGTSYAWEHRYTGRRLDPGSGLQLNRHRYYHTSLGRWCSRDPIGYRAHGLNFYQYVGNSPAVRLDPSGLDWLDDYADWYSETFGYGGEIATAAAEGIVVGAAVTAVVIVAAPVAVSAGTGVLVAAGVSSTTAATVATGTVTGTLLVAGGAGAVATGVSIYEDANDGDWEAVAFGGGTVVGGLAVGALGGGRCVAERIAGEPSPSPNTYNPIRLLSNEIDLMFNPTIGPANMGYWATSPTPLSGGVTAATTASGVISTPSLFE